MKLELTDQEIQVLGKGLGMLPYSEVALLVNTINKQLQDQKENNEE